MTDQSLEGRDDGGGPVSVVSSAAFSGAPQAVAQVTGPVLLVTVFIFIKYRKYLLVPQFPQIIFKIQIWFKKLNSIF